jgi:hypothetical protein
MTYQQHNPSVMRQLASYGELLKIHARSQMRLDQIRTEAAVRSMAQTAAVLAAGAQRNVILGAILPAAIAAAEDRRLRRSRR